VYSHSSIPSTRPDRIQGPPSLLPITGRPFSLICDDLNMELTNSHTGSAEVKKALSFKCPPDHASSLGAQRLPVGIQFEDVVMVRCQRRMWLITVKCSVCRRIPNRPSGHFYPHSVTELLDPSTSLPYAKKCVSQTMLLLEPEITHPPPR